MINKEGVIAYGRELTWYLDYHKPEFRECRNAIMAQMIKETGWAGSELFKIHNNPAGMKYRSCFDEIDWITPADYVDWEEAAKDPNEHQLDIHIESLEMAPAAYFLFLGRPRYKGYEKYARSGDSLIRHLANRGWCASTPGIYRQDFVPGIIGDKQYAKAVHDDYYQRIIDIQRGKVFKRLMKEIDAQPIERELPFSEWEGVPYLLPEEN